MAQRKLSYIALLCIGLLCSQSQVNAQLATNVEVTRHGSSFIYTLLNNEPIDSQRFLTTFHLTLNAPITVTNSPLGWDFITDNKTYIDWFSTDSDVPYEHDIGPGSSLGGFTIESTIKTTNTLPYDLTFWNHGSDTPDIGVQGTIMVPFTDTESIEEEIFLPLITQ